MRYQLIQKALFAVCSTSYYHALNIRGFQRQVSERGFVYFNPNRFIICFSNAVAFYAPLTNTKNVVCCSQCIVEACSWHLKREYKGSCKSVYLVQSKPLYHLLRQRRHILRTFSYYESCCVLFPVHRDSMLMVSQRWISKTERRAFVQFTLTLNTLWFSSIVAFRAPSTPAEFLNCSSGSFVLSHYGF